MDKNERLQLEKMINMNNVEDVTQDIRERKHSVLIKADIQKMINLKQEYNRLSITNPETFEAMLIKNCNFLFTNYFDIFNRIKKNEINLEIMSKFLSVLKMIEDGKLDQHEGAYHVGQLLKELYIDSAVTRGEKIDQKNNKNKTKVAKPTTTKNISWGEFKNMKSKDL